MELSQPRPYGSEGRKPTHDFLSLYSHSTAQLDPRPPSQGNYLETHDFLQPLERVGKGFAAKEENVVAIEVSERPPLPPVEHVLPGGIGTYSISHVNSFSPLRSPKVEGVVFAVAQTSSADRITNDNSNSSSYAGSGFTLWEQSAAKKGKTGKENTRGNLGVLEATAGGAGQWGSSSERPSQSSSSNHHGNFSSISSSQVSRSHSFMEMIKSAKGSSSNHEDELEEEDHSALKKEISSVSINPKELRVKVDGKSSDQKANTPRSKHSATEQRRRSKINDRFQMLRQLIPHGDQKRDKASFLLEVIEYVQFLQEKVQKYEGHYPGWNNEQTKLIPWRNKNGQGANSGPGPASLAYSTKFDEKPLLVSPMVPGSAPNPVESDIITHKVMNFPTVRTGGVVPQAVPLRLQSDIANTSAQPQSQSCQPQSCTMVNGDKVKEEDLTVEDGIINISSAYSQRLLTTLTQALHCSGIDLSKAAISVQIELGKRAKNRTAPATSITKDNEISPCNLGMKHSRAPIAEESEVAQKKLKTSKN